jgi:spermidine export protein MdtJ
MTPDPHPLPPKSGAARRLAWLYLALAVGIEVVGLTFMKAASLTGGMSGYLVMYVAIALSYVCLAKAVRTLSVGVAYAIWEGSGIALITLVSVFFFHHALSIREFIGLAMAVIGIILVNAGEDHGDAPADDDDGHAAGGR